MKYLFTFILLLVSTQAHAGFLSGFVVGTMMSSSSSQSGSSGSGKEFMEVSMCHDESKKMLINVFTITSVYEGRSSLKISFAGNSEGCLRMSYADFKKKYLKENPSLEERLQALPANERIKVLEEMLKQEKAQVVKK